MAPELRSRLKNKRPGARQRRVESLLPTIAQHHRNSSCRAPSDKTHPTHDTDLEPSQEPKMVALPDATSTQIQLTLRKSRYSSFIAKFRKLPAADQEAAIIMILDDLIWRTLSREELGETASPGMTVKNLKPLLDNLMPPLGHDNLEAFFMESLYKIISILGGTVTDRILHSVTTLLKYGLPVKHMIREVNSYGRSEVGMAVTSSLKAGQSTGLYAVMNFMSLKPDKQHPSTESRDALAMMVEETYTFAIESEKKIFMGSGMLRGVNHSCVPNAKFVFTRRQVVFTDTQGCEVRNRRIRVVEVVALRDIKAGEEITVSYDDAYFGEGNWRCGCPHTQCHGPKQLVATKKSVRHSRLSCLPLPSARTKKEHRIDAMGRTRAATKAAQIAIPKEVAIPVIPSIEQLPTSTNKPRQTAVRFSDANKENVPPLRTSTGGVKGGNRLSRGITLALAPIVETAIPQKQSFVEDIILRGHRPSTIRAFHALGNLSINAL